MMTVKRMIEEKELQLPLRVSSTDVQFNSKDAGVVNGENGGEEGEAWVGENDMHVEGEVSREVARGDVEMLDAVPPDDQHSSFTAWSSCSTPRRRMTNNSFMG